MYCCGCCRRVCFFVVVSVFADYIVGLRYAVRGSVRLGSGFEMSVGCCSVGWCSVVF